MNGGVVMQIKECNINDIPLLAEMNLCLIKDEGAETNLTLPQLEERMKNFIISEYKAFFFSQDDRIIGYALCDMSKTPVYLRQFFICPTDRRKGYGKQAFYRLSAHLDAREIDVDVYAWNTPGISFWESIGFKKRYYNMRYKK